MSDSTIPELPSESLRFRVAGTAKADWFWKSGGMSIGNIGTMLSIIGKSFTDYARALEFGCGCGRMLLHLEDVGRQIELYGVDIDAEAIAWASAHIPWVKCSVNQGLPPLAFPDAYFDLVFNQSVFTHLDEGYQDAWLAELRRIVRPGGTLVLSVSGDHPFEQLLKAHRDGGGNPSALVEQYRTKGIVYIADDSWVGGPFPDFYHSAFHAPWYVFEHWSRYFDIQAYVPRGSLDFQDYVLLRRPERDIGAALPAREVSEASAAPEVPKPRQTVTGRWRSRIRSKLRRHGLLRR